MDVGSHFLSGVALALCLPDHPDPVKNYLHKGLVVIGAVVADAPVPLIWRRIGKMTEKSVLRLKLTEDDWSNFAPAIKPWYMIYKVLHSYAILKIPAIIEALIFRNLFFTLGLLLHQVYDLPTHKYENREANPKPLYPFSDITFVGGLTNNWTWKWHHFGISWAIHGVIIAIALIIRHTLV